MQRLKQRYRNFRIKYLDQSYLRELREKTMTYDSWIVKKEEEWYSSLPAVKNPKKEKDYYLFVRSFREVSFLAVREIEYIFQKEKQVAVVYGDEDEIKGDTRVNPLFKPDYSPDTLTSYFYFGSLVAVKKDALDPFLKKKLPPEQWLVEFDTIGKKELYEAVLSLCLSLKRENIYHSRHILSTCEKIESWGFEKEYDELRQEAYRKRTRKAVGAVSIIIPSKDNQEVLERCLRSIEFFTDKADYEIIVVDNGSSPGNREQIEILQLKYGFTYLYEPMVFNFSKMCNLGACRAKNPYLLFLNDDCQVKTNQWLEEMVRLAAIKETGAVGMKLYYPESEMLQHCGIYALNMGPVHKLQFQKDDMVHYDRRNQDVRNVLAVTGACLMIRRNVFRMIKGFDEELQVAFNDVDLCYRLYEAGYNNVIINTHYLWHYESLSRGSDDSKEKRERFLQEKKRLYEKHPKLWGHDPYYHPAFTADILDVGYSFSYQYKEKPYISGNLKKIKALPRKLREDACVAPLFEHCGNSMEWFLAEDRIKMVKGIPTKEGEKKEVREENNTDWEALTINEKKQPMERKRQTKEEKRLLKEEKKRDRKAEKSLRKERKRQTKEEKRLLKEEKKRDRKEEKSLRKERKRQTKEEKRLLKEKKSKRNEEKRLLKERKRQIKEETVRGSKKKQVKAEKRRSKAEQKRQRKEEKKQQSLEEKSRIQTEKSQRKEKKRQRKAEKIQRKEEKKRIKLENKQVSVRDMIYLQGNAVVLGSDNACYKKYLILWGESRRIFYKMTLPTCYRPDVERNLQEQKNVGLSGFACFINPNTIEEGEYRVCLMVKDKISGSCIIRRTSNYIVKKS